VKRTLHLVPLFIATAAMAQAPTFESEITDLATSVSGQILVGLGGVAAVLALALGIGFVWRKIKAATRAA